MTATALTEIVAKGNDAVLGLFNELVDRSAKVVLLVLRYGQLHIVSGSGKGDEDDLVLNMADPLSAVRQRLDLDGLRCSGLQLLDPRMCFALVIDRLRTSMLHRVSQNPTHVMCGLRSLSVGRVRMLSREGHFQLLDVSV